MQLVGLTLVQPWATAVVRGPKFVENRKWRPSPKRVAGELWIAVHAGLTWDEDGARFIREAWPDMPEGNRETVLESGREPYPTGKILGIARVAHVRAPEDLRGRDACAWGFGPWCWILESRCELAEPIQARGAMGLWPLPPPIEAYLRPLCTRIAPARCSHGDRVERCKLEHRDLLGELL